MSQCPDNAFWNSTTNACETFTVGTPPPPLPADVPWSWWQWALLAGAVTLVGFGAFRFYEHRKSRHLLPDFFEHE